MCRFLLSPSYPLIPLAVPVQSGVLAFVFLLARLEDVLANPQSLQEVGFALYTDLEVWESWSPEA